MDLEILYKKYNRFDLIEPDPLMFVYRYKNIGDKEVVALISACFAYGNVKQIIKNLTKIFDVMGSSPKKYLLSKTKQDFKKDFKNFKYRFTTEEELVNFLLAIKTILEKEKTLENLFYKFYLQGKKDFLFALNNFCKELRAHGKVATLVPDPDKKSALKRINLFLRWCVRKDNVDCGLWHKIPTACLIVPLDVHMHRNARALGLTKRNQTDMKTALEISCSLAKFCKNDPIKYDFCITRFGIHPDFKKKNIKENV